MVHCHILKFAHLVIVIGVSQKCGKKTRVILLFLLEEGGGGQYNMIIIYGIYIALYPDAQSALQDFVGDFARLLVLGANCRHAVHNLIKENSRIYRCPQNRISD